MRARLVLAALPLVSTLVSSAGASLVPLCPGGRFAVLGPPLVGPGGDGSDGVLIAGTQISIGLNAHYHNDYSIPIQMKVWTNLLPYDGTPGHIAQTLTALDSTFNINVPPFTQQLQHGHFVNRTAQPMSFIGLSGHMHKRGLRFTAWDSSGATLYENYDWGHPLTRQFDPPHVLAPGDYVDYECLEDNGVTRPVRLDAAGNPTTLSFGVTTDDEMCILTGAYY